MGSGGRGIEVVGEGGVRVDGECDEGCVFRLLRTHVTATGGRSI